MPRHSDNAGKSFPTAVEAIGGTFRYWNPGWPTCSRTWAMRRMRAGS
jgi:hypothetical protein